MSFSVNSKSRSNGSSQTDKSNRADAKDSTPKQPEVKKNEARPEESRFEKQSQREPQRNLLQAPQKTDTYWQDTARQKDEAIQNEAKALWKSELGRDIPADEAARLGEQARKAGCVNETEARAFFQKMIAGSPEKAALNNNLHPQAAPAMSPNEAFITQFKNDQFNPTGPNGSTNCGPTSLAISMAYTGHMPPGLSKEQQVDYARALMHPEVTTKEQGLSWVKDANGNNVPQLNRDQELTGGTMEQDGIRAAGGNPAFGKGWEELDKALQNGPVLSNGFYGPAWRDQFGPRANTGNTPTHPEGIGHVNCILGKTPEGKYLVADPMSRKGVVEMTREQLSTFYPKSGGSPTFAATNLGGSAPSTPATGTPPAVPAAGTLPPAGLRYDGGKTYNADVEQLQKMLVQTGYLKESDRQTGPGFYGDKTAAAVRKLQSEYGVPGDGRSFDASTRAALEKKLAGTAPTAPTAPTPGTPAPQGDYEKLIADAIANAPKDNASLRPYWTKFAAEVAPKLEAAGVSREQIKKAILWGLSEGTTTSGTNSKYRMENGSPTSAITYSNLGDNRAINGSTQTPTGQEINPDTGKPFSTWQVGIAGVQVREAVNNGWLKNSFEALYPGQTPQQVGQRMLDLMGETDEKTFPNLTLEQLADPKNGKWAAVLLRDPAINIMSMTQHGNLDFWLNKNRDRLEKESPGYFDQMKRLVDSTFG